MINKKTGLYTLTKSEVRDILFKNELKIEYEFSTFTPGTLMLAASVKVCEFPLALVWLRPLYSVSYESVYIINSFVVPEFRQCGLRSVLNDYIVEYWKTKTIISGGASKSGLAFMKSYGYKWTGKQWIWEKPKKWKPKNKELLP